MTVPVVLIALLALGSLFPFLFSVNLAIPPPKETASSCLGQPITDGAAPAPLLQRCLPGACIPRRYFSTTNRNPPFYYHEPNQDPTGRHGIFSDLPSRPWDESSITPLDLRANSVNAVDGILKTIQWRYNELIESDLRGVLPLPKYLPPQFPQWDRAILRHFVEADTKILGLPPQCCPTNINHQFLTRNMSAANVLSEEELNDCKCRSPRNYPEGVGRPIATIVTAFYEMSSKHPVKMYQKTAGQLLANADPMIIFCEPNTTWVDFFIGQRKHAPTIVVPLSANNLRLKQHFPQETFWKNQYEIDPEGPTHHKGVNTMLYIIWLEKLVLLHSAAMLNPFNTTQFLWVDTGYFRNPAPHVYRQSIVRINITEEGVKEESTLLFQMIEYAYAWDAVISGNQVLIGGNSFIGTYTGISNLYSAFYDTFWNMLATGQFVGSDQKVMYRTCHTYPDACHIHKARKYRQWSKMLGELLPGIEGGEKIGEPLRLHEFVVPEDKVPIPPNGIVDDAF
ncbi:hypothetical protein ACHAW5_009471 [Stephanodiscus triporus]|uniref:Uncharacterized protein n=1 Tax=Stephanodiscus triporus TaxID=2934178 RepID=A0ABD3QU26_9STRA